MRFWVLLAGLCCASAGMNAHAAGMGDEIVYIGTHGAGGPQEPAPSGPKHGVYVAHLNVESGHLSTPTLAVELQRATWLVVNPALPVLYSVAQAAGGMDADSDIYSFEIDPSSGALHPQSKVSAGGHDATHMDLDIHSQSLFLANYGSSTLTVLPVGKDGGLGHVAATQQEPGSGPHRRQKSGHAHGVAMDPSHRFVLVANLGTDRVYVYEFDRATRALKPAATPEVALPPGSGPRHLVFQPTQHILYMNNELSGELRSFTFDAKGDLKPLQTLSPYAADFNGEKSAGEIGLSPNGKTLYLSLRGDVDALIVYAVDGHSGLLREVQRLSSGGKVPWSFGIDPSGRWLLVTNETSGSVNVFGIDPETGTLRATGEFVDVPKPVAVAFFRH